MREQLEESFVCEPAQEEIRLLLVPLLCPPKAVSKLDADAIAVSAALLTWIPSLGYVAEGCADGSSLFVTLGRTLF